MVLPADVASADAVGRNPRGWVRVSAALTGPDNHPNTGPQDTPPAGPSAGRRERHYGGSRRFFIPKLPNGSWLKKPGIID